MTKRDVKSKIKAVEEIIKSKESRGEDTTYERNLLKGYYEVLKTMTE